MIRLALVAGKVVDGLVDVLDSREYKVEYTYETIDQLWEDILLRGSSAFIDVDKIVVMGMGFLNENDMPHDEQVLNLQSIMAMENLRSTLYFITKDADLYNKVQESPEEYILFRNFNMFAFKEMTTKNFVDVVKGHYDAKGLFHPDFLRKNEIDEALTKQDSDEDIIDEDTEEEEEEKYIDYVDSEENKKAIKKAELENKRAKVKRVKEESGSGFPWFGKKKNKDNTDEISKKRKNEKSLSKKNKGFVDLYRGVIAVTGDRQSGVSTTVANMAEIYAKNGNSVLIIDLDVKRRSQTTIFPNFKDSIQIDSRVSHGLLVSLVNPKNLDSVNSVVSDNIAVLSISQEIERDIKKFANRPFEQIFTAANMVNLLSFSKSLFDVVIIDLPLSALKKVGACLSYVDKVVMCIPNTPYHLDSLLEIEIEDLLLQNDLIAHTLMSKSKILLTKYNSYSYLEGREMTPELVMDTLSSLEESFYHLEVIGKIPYSLEYEKQFNKGKKIVITDNDYRYYFEDFMELI